MISKKSRVRNLLNHDPKFLDAWKAERPPVEETARFALNNPSFKADCESLGVEPTLRQARKWLKKEGKFAPAAV